MLPGVTLPASLAVLLGALRPCFTAPSFRMFCGLAAGLAGQVRRRTVAGMLLGAGLARAWPHDRAHYFFARACLADRRAGPGRRPARGAAAGAGLVALLAAAFPGRPIDVVADPAYHGPAPARSSSAAPATCPARRRRAGRPAAPARDGTARSDTRRAGSSPGRARYPRPCPGPAPAARGGPARSRSAVRRSRHRWPAGLPACPRPAAAAQPG